MKNKTNTMKELLGKTKKSDIVEYALIEQLEKTMLHYHEEKERTKENKMQVACAGLYNAGKSTLLNALIGKDVFATGDIPTTNTNDSYEKDGVVFMDTPGLSANEKDNITALDGYKKADYIIFVSNVQNGGLNKSELGFLKSILDIMGNQQIFNENVIFVMSYGAELEEQDYEVVLKKHQEYIERELGILLKKIWIYDAVRYAKGVELGNDALIQKSGLGEFKEYLFKELEAKKEQKQKTDEARIEQSVKELKKYILEILSSLEHKIEKSTQKKGISAKEVKEIEELRKKYSSDVKSFFETLKVPENSPVSSGVYFENPLHGGYKKFDSERAARSFVREKIGYLYDKREKKAARAVREMLEGFLDYCEFNMTDGNKYYQAIQEIETIISQYLMEINKYNVEISLDLQTSFHTKPDTKKLDEIRQSLNSRLSDDVVEYGQYYSVDYYSDLVDFEEMEESYTGLFGSLKYKTTYSVYVHNLYKGIEEMTKDINNNLRSNREGVWGSIKRVMEEFYHNLNQESSKIMKTISVSIDEFINKSKNDSSATELKEYTELKTAWEKYLSEL